MSIASIAEISEKQETMELNKLMAAQSKRGTVFAITSGKGGVGKTNIAVNMAVCLAAAQKKVILLDADFGLANIDVVMGISSKYNMAHVIGGFKSFDEIIHIGPAGVEVICGVCGIEDLAELGQFQRQRLIDEMNRFQDTADVIIIDTAAGLTKTVLGFCFAADNVLVVATPEPAAMTDSYAMIKALAVHKYNGKISVIVNMAQSIAEGKRVYRQIADVAQKFLGNAVYEAGILPKDDRLSVAVRQRKPVVLAYPKSDISLSFAAMAAKIARNQAAKTQRDSFLKKVTNWFF